MILVICAIHIVCLYTTYIAIPLLLHVYVYSIYIYVCVCKCVSAYDFCMHTSHACTVYVYYWKYLCIHIMHVCMYIHSKLRTVFCTSDHNIITWSTTTSSWGHTLTTQLKIKSCSFTSYWCLRQYPPATVSGNIISMCFCTLWRMWWLQPYYKALKRYKQINIHSASCTNKLISYWINSTIIIHEASIISKTWQTHNYCASCIQTLTHAMHIYTNI